MKKLFVLALFLLFAASTFAADMTLAWDANTGPAWDKVRIYKRTGTTPPYTYVQKVEVAGTVTTATITGVFPGEIYIARSLLGSWESVDSNSVNTGAVPSAPGNIRITVIVNVNP